MSEPLTREDLNESLKPVLIRLDAHDARFDATDARLTEVIGVLYELKTSLPEMWKEYVRDLDRSFRSHVERLYGRMGDLDTEHTIQGEQLRRLEEEQVVQNDRLTRLEQK